MMKDKTTRQTAAEKAAPRSHTPEVDSADGVRAGRGAGAGDEAARPLVEGLMEPSDASPSRPADDSSLPIQGTRPSAPGTCGRLSARMKK